MTEWLMYASVEMLLKFCAANCSFNCTGPRIREKRGPAHTPDFCKEEKTHWRSRHFTQPLPAVRIHFALVEFSPTISPIFCAAGFALVGTCNETEKNHSLC